MIVGYCKRLAVLPLIFSLAACNSLPDIKDILIPPDKETGTENKNPRSLPGPSVLDNLSSQEIKELRTIYQQPYIDPITDYLKKHEKNEKKKVVNQWLIGERRKRCRTILKIYLERPKNQASLKRLKNNYNYSCPGVITAFAKLVKDVPAESVPSETTETPPEPQEMQTAETTPPPDETITEAIEPTQAEAPNPHVEECYLLFAINNFDEALSACEKAAEREDAGAQHKLSVIYDKLEQSTQSLNWLRKAVQHGFASAQYDLGQLHYNGRLVDKDYSKANEWFRSAAAQGLPEAQNALGIIYLDGKGVEPDYQEAASWFRQAAQQGQHAAQFQLGQLYLEGKGVAKDLDRGVTWLSKAGEQGYLKAQLQLGQLYETQAVLPQNLEDAYLWFSLAGAQGNADSAQKAKRINVRLSSVQRESGQQRIRDIAAKYQ